MNAKALCGGWGGIALLVLGALVLPGLCADPASSTDPGRSAQNLVQTALRAEVSGDMKARSAALSQALSKDPEYAPARWHSGYVSTGGQWVSIEDVQRRSAADPRLAEYRRLRDAQAGTPPGELALARWCKENRLFDQARFHWKRVLLSQPQNLEALKSLGVQWYQGRLLTPEEIKQAQADRAQLAKDRAQYRTERRRWQKHWELQVVKWRQAAKQGDSGLGESIRSELDAIDLSNAVIASAAINTLHAVVLERSAADKDQESYLAIGLALVKALDAIVEPAATHSMIVYSVDHPIAEVRAAAADALKKRPKEMYVPWLLARMESPIESSFAIVVLPTGSVVYEHSFFREGPEADFLDVRSKSTFIGCSGPQLASFQPAPKNSTPVGRALAPSRRESSIGATIRQAAATSTTAQVVAATTAASTERGVEQTNAVAAAVNQCVQDALRRATGADLDALPRRWYDLWKDYCYQKYELESPMEYPQERPVYERYSFGVSRYTCPTAPSVGAFTM